MTSKRNLAQNMPEVKLMRQFQLHAGLSDSLAHLSVDHRDQVPLEEEEGALDDGNYNIGDECASPKGDNENSKNTIRPGRIIYRDSSILSTSEIGDTLLEEDEVIYSL